MKETTDIKLLKRIVEGHKAVSLSITDAYGNIEAEVYLAHVMYIPNSNSFIAYWDPLDCSETRTCGYRPPQIPKGKHSWKLNGCYDTALYKNLKILDACLLGGL